MFAIITGASGGIGRALAYKYAEHGYDLVLTCEKNVEALNNIKEDINTKYKKKVIAKKGLLENVDVPDDIYILINNAGKCDYNLLQDVSYERYKTPLLRSMEALNKQAMRIVKLFGHRDVKSVRTNVGVEQEYFLVSKETYDKRKDLIFTGRTLFGAKSPKGQELDDHYFGAIKPQVSEFMKDLNEELWKLGVLAKTEHNEAAPSQHELAPVFTTGNIAADHNQLTMELMQKIAKKHGLVCLLHEKPFEGVNGSGKHNNWSISTDTGINLLAPGETPYENAQFLLFFAAVIKAVDEYQDLLRISVASAGNDHRLGAHEAPPAIVSIFIGDELEAVIEALETDSAYDGAVKDLMKTGVKAVPRFAKDTTDRNRTSPFAFTGNKFEFRMLGSSASISDCNVVINTMVAEELRQFANILEKSENFDETLHGIIKDVIKNHKRIIFNGNGYDEAWQVEAEKRGLMNLRTTPDCLPHFLDEKNVKLFTSHKVLSLEEMNSRYEIYLENYCKVLNIEALTMVDMARKDILPAVSEYTHKVIETAESKKKFLGDDSCLYESELAASLSDLTKRAYETLKALEAGKESRAESAFVRFQELIDLTIRDGRLGQSASARSAMWEELCRFRELYCAAFEERNLPELAAANRYLDQFASIR